MTLKMCPPCPRTPVHHVSGLYTSKERGNRSQRLGEEPRLDWSNHRSQISTRDSGKSSPGGEDLGEGGL